jgi:imidazole glycerol-phosphate synthase subunit HisH
MPESPRVAIVDYDLGNLFSVGQACERAGLAVMVTSSPDVVASADAVILPGVGAFRDAMAALERLDLVGPLRDVAASGRPLMGVCLGMQLLMNESTEFGHHRGLGVVPGAVESLADAMTGPRPKIPHVGWSQMVRVPRASGDVWAGTLLRGLPDGVYMHFVHSYFVRPAHQEHAIAHTRYGELSFCSALQWNNVFGCQGHPERSGPLGLTVYQNFAAVLHTRRREHA